MKTKTKSQKFFAFLAAFLISVLALNAYALNNLSYTDSEEENLMFDEAAYSYKVLRIKRSKCINTQECLKIAPDHLYTLDEKVKVKAGVTSITMSLAEDLVSACPVGVFVIDNL